MTPKEKAIELYEKFYYAIHLDGNQDYSNSADKSALICVNEILLSLEGFSTITYLKRKNYWEEVKSELQKL